MTKDIIIENKMELSENGPFLMRQVVLKPRTAKEAVEVLKDAIAKDQNLQLIVTPRVDKGRKAYFYIGVRKDRQEVDFKLPVSKETRNYVLAHLNGEQVLPEISTYEPETVASADEAAWFENLEDHLRDMNAVGKEKVEITDNASYLKVTYKMRNGKISIEKGVVESLFSLLGID